MCLHNAKVCVRELFGRNKESIDCWKVVRRGCSYRTRNNIYPIFYKVNKKYELGKTYKSDRKNKRINRDDDTVYGYTIHRGIHVFTDYNEAKNWCKYGEHIVKVKCLRSNYVAHNEEKKQAVFMAVKFTKEISFDPKSW